MPKFKIEVVRCLRRTVHVEVEAENYREAALDALQTAEDRFDIETAGDSDFGNPDHWHKARLLEGEAEEGFGVAAPQIRIPNPDTIY